MWRSKQSQVFEGIYGGYGYGIRDAEVTRILDMCAATNLVVGNSFFKKDINKLITFTSAGTKTQMDYILARHGNLKHTENMEVICGEQCAPPPPNIDS